MLMLVLLISVAIALCFLAEALGSYRATRERSYGKEPCPIPEAETLAGPPSPAQPDSTAPG